MEGQLLIEYCQFGNFKMSKADLLTIFFILPNLIILFLLRKASLDYFTLYQIHKKINYPLTPKETTENIKNAPADFFKKLPVIPFIMWGTIFEKHNNIKLNKSVWKVRKMLLLFFTYNILFFFDCILINLIQF